MRRVLVLAYNFPPIGGAGVQRSAKFVRYLPTSGWQPVVVAGRTEPGARWSPEDSSLLDDIPAGTEVHRVRTPPPAAGRWRNTGARWLGTTSAFGRWWTDEAIAVAREAGPTPELVYASMSPYESATAASVIAREIGVEWVADLRDPWALDEVQVYPTGLHRRLQLTRMRRALATAGAIVMNTPEAVAALLRAAPELATKPVVSISNGFDAADFGGSPPKRDDDAFRIVHAGYLHTELGAKHRRRSAVRRLAGGAVEGVDLLARSHVHLIAALDDLLDEQPQLASKLELHLAGILSAADSAVADRPYVRTHGYLAHGKTVDLIRSADLLFLPMHGLPSGTRATIVPGKTYEYLAAGRPILAAVPDGDARDLLQAAGSAFLCRPDDVGAMMTAIAKHVEVWRAGPSVAKVPSRLLERYERRRLTMDLASVFDRVAARHVRVAAS